MTLHAYLTDPAAKSLTDLSLAIGVSKGRLSQLRHSEDWPPELALKAESATEGRLNAGTLSKVIAEARFRQVPL
jgi:DNA-binding transcriptional regulator YdaS (Cro superfamily)